MIYFRAAPGEVFLYDVLYISELPRVRCLYMIYFRAAPGEVFIYDIFYISELPRVRS